MSLTKFFEKNYNQIVESAQRIDPNFYIQDCVNDVYLQIAKRFPTLGFNDDSTCMAYILGSVKNRYYDMKAREDRYTDEVLDIEDDSYHDRILKVEMSNTIDEIHDDIFNVFGEDQAYIFYLRFMENLTYVAIAEEMEMSPKTVFRRVSKLFDYIIENYGA